MPVLPRPTARIPCQQRRGIVRHVVRYIPGDPFGVAIAIAEVASPIVRAIRAIYWQLLGRIDRPGGIQDVSIELWADFS